MYKNFGYYTNILEYHRFFRCSNKHLVFHFKANLVELISLCLTVYFYRQVIKYFVIDLTFNRNNLFGIANHNIFDNAFPKSRICQLNSFLSKLFLNTISSNKGSVVWVFEFWRIQTVRHNIIYLQIHFNVYALMEFKCKARLAKVRF